MTGDDEKVRDLMAPFESLEGALRTFSKNSDCVPKSFSSTAIQSPLPDGTAKTELGTSPSHSSLFFSGKLRTTELRLKPGGLGRAWGSENKVFRLNLCQTRSQLSLFAREIDWKQID